MNEAKFNIWLQPGTRAHMLVYKPDKQVWQLWTATNSRTGNSDTWLGTYLEVYAGGKCTQHIRTETSLTEIEIRPTTLFDIEDN